MLTPLSRPVAVVVCGPVGRSHTIQIATKFTVLPVAPQLIQVFQATGRATPVTEEHTYIKRKANSDDERIPSSLQHARKHPRKVGLRKHRPGTPKYPRRSQEAPCTCEPANTQHPWLGILYDQSVMKVQTVHSNQMQANNSALVLLDTPHMFWMTVSP